MVRPPVQKIKIALVALQLVGTRIHISRLKEFYGEGEKHFNIELDELTSQVGHLAPEEWNEVGNLFIDEHSDLEALLQLKRRFAIVGLFTVFEVFLRKTLEYVHQPDWAMSKRIPEMRLDDLKKEFSNLGVAITKPAADWKLIMGMKEVRNCITHSDSFPDEKRAKKLANYGIPVIYGKMTLPNEYFEESVDIVERTCERIAKDCRYALLEGRVNITMPTDAGRIGQPRGFTWSGLANQVLTFSGEGLRRQVAKRYDRIGEK